MQVILRQDVEKIGQRGDIVDVSRESDSMSGLTRLTSQRRIC